MGQQDLIRTYNVGNKGITCKNPGLLLTVPENPMKYQVSVELGSPFTANKFLDFHSDSLFGGRIDIRTTFPLNFSSSLCDPPKSDTDSQDEEAREDITEDVNEDTQCIYIPSTSPFYHPPAKAHPFASSSSNLSFSCDALPENGSFRKQPATSFCESRPPASDEWGEDSKSTVCSYQKHDQDLSLFPVEIFEENSFSPTSPVPIYLKISEIASYKPLPDVPRGVDFEYDYEEYDSESSCSSSDLEEERKEGPVCPIDAAPPLDRHLVAPFEHYGHRSFRASVVPKTSFCGLF